MDTLDLYIEDRAQRNLCRSRKVRQTEDKLYEGSNTSKTCQRHKDEQASCLTCKPAGCGLIPCSPKKGCRRLYRADIVKRYLRRKFHKNLKILLGPIKLNWDKLSWNAGRRW